MVPAKPLFIRRSAALLCAALALQPGFSSGQAAPPCSEEIAEFLNDLPLYDGEVKDIRIIERTNIADDFGPETFGVDAWIRLESCSGYVVLNLNKSCFLRQAYTRGDCEVGGLSKY